LWLTPNYVDYIKEAGVELFSTINFQTQKSVDIKHCLPSFKRKKVWTSIFFTIFQLYFSEILVKHQSFFISLARKVGTIIKFEHRGWRCSILIDDVDNMQLVNVEDQTKVDVA